MKNILVIEDSRQIREAVSNYLILNDFSTRPCASIEEARLSLEKESPTLAIVDISLPDGNGFFFAKDELTPRDIPFLILSSHADESDKVLGFELGAEDYITKPFSLKELILRVKGILGRHIQKQEDSHSQKYFQLEEDRMMVMETSHTVTINDEKVVLTPTEWTILTCLISHDGAILSRDQILKSIWFISDKMSYKTLDSHIKNIRFKLKNTAWIETVRGFGFRFGGTKSNAEER